MHLNVALRPLILAAEEVLDLDYQLRQRTVHERGQERGVLLNQGWTLARLLVGAFRSMLKT